MKTSRKIIFISLSFLLLAGTFAAGFFTGKTSVVCPFCQPEEVDFSLFWQAWDQIKAKYVGRADLDTQKMIYGAISGMVESLGDPYTVFFPPEESKEFKEDVTGVFEGIGMEIGLKDNQLQVVAPLENTPAQRAGFRAGDLIMEINGTSTSGMSSDQAVKLIRGKKGTTVTLLIMRDGWKEAKEFKLVRDTIQVPSLKLEYIDLGDNQQAAHLTLYQFSEQAYYDFYESAIKILNNGSKKIILDLRNNPGGYLEVAQSIGGWFLDKGQAVVIEDFGNGKGQEIYKSEGPSNLSDYSVVVLINGGSASAAEILAGALRDNNGAKLVGEKSFGKGSVQELAELQGGSSIKITVAKWLTPKGSQITGIGLDPDVKVENTDQDIADGKDAQLDKAIEIIKGL